MLNILCSTTHIVKKGTLKFLSNFIYRVFIKYCVFPKILRYILDSGLYRFPFRVSVCVHNGRSNTSAAAAKLAEFRKITTFMEKHNIYWTPCIILFFFVEIHLLLNFEKLKFSLINKFDVHYKPLANERTLLMVFVFVT